MSTALAPSSSRLTSLSLVIGVHALLIVGLSAGLIGPAAKPPPAPPQVEIVKETLPPPEPPQPVVREFSPQAPVIAQVPWPERFAEAQPAISVQPTELPAQIPFEAQPARTPDAQGSAVQPALAKQPAGLLCPTQTRPQLPAAAQEGSAHLRVLATVQGGRVTAVQTTTLRALPDRRAQRALLAEVEQTLRNGYACTQDGVFEQEFLFRVD